MADDEPKDDLDLARRVAGICGPFSAAAKAVAEYEQRVAAGEEPICIQQAGKWLVMPRSAYESISR